MKFIVFEKQNGVAVPLQYNAAIIVIFRFLERQKAKVA